MSLLRYIRKRKPTSASVAKERLQIIVSHQRQAQESADYLPMLQRELVEVIAKYVEIDKDQVRVDLERVGDRSVLELNISLPDVIGAPKETAEEEATA